MERAASNRHPLSSILQAYLPHRSLEQRFQQMPVAMLLILGAMTQEGQGLGSRQMLKEAKSEFLAVILDLLIAAINRPVFAQFPAISDAELAPGDFSR